jgi:hypothetical protein
MRLLVLPTGSWLICRLYCGQFAEQSSPLNAKAWAPALEGDPDAASRLSDLLLALIPAPGSALDASGAAAR